MDAYNKRFKKQKFQGEACSEVEQKNFDRYELLTTAKFSSYEGEKDLQELKEKLNNAVKDYKVKVDFGCGVELKNFGRWELSLRVTDVKHGGDADLRRLHARVTTAIEDVLKEYK